MTRLHQITSPVIHRRICSFQLAQSDVTMSINFWMLFKMSNYHQMPPVLSTGTGIPKTLAEAKRSPEWPHWQSSLHMKLR